MNSQLLNNLLLSQHMSGRGFDNPETLKKALDTKRANAQARAQAKKQRAINAMVAKQLQSEYTASKKVAKAPKAKAPAKAKKAKAPASAPVNKELKKLITAQKNQLKKFEKLAKGKKPKRVMCFV